MASATTSFSTCGHGSFAFNANGLAGAATSSLCAAYRRVGPRMDFATVPIPPMRSTHSRLIAGELDRCYFLPIEQFARRRAIQLRLGPTRNNQQLLINWATDFEFAAKLGSAGAVAQLGERERGTLEAAGSSPAGST